MTPALNGWRFFCNLGSSDNKPFAKAVDSDPLNVLKREHLR